MTEKSKLKFHNLGVSTTMHRAAEECLPDVKLFHYGLESSDFGIVWMYYEQDCEPPEIVKTMPHIAFEVDDVYEAIEGRNLIIEPNSPSEGTVVAFIEEDGLTIEFIRKL